jgi:hypothetical protein
MPTQRTPMLAALLEGKSFTWTAPDGGDFASMRKAIRHGQTLTISPIADLAEIQAGDMVLVKWHAGHLFHVVGEIQGQRFLIVNSLGKVNGWVDGADILGRVTKVVDPQPRPDVPHMLSQLYETFLSLIDFHQAGEEDAHRLLGVAEDLRWYAGRLGPQRWDEIPRTNKWSLAQNLWQLLKRARAQSAPAEHNSIKYWIDCGVQYVGLAAETLAFFEYGESELGLK